MGIFNLFKNKKLDIKKELFDNKITTTNEMVAFVVVDIINDFYVRILKSEPDKNYRNNSDTKYEKAILLEYVLDKVNRLCVNDDDWELFEIIEVKVRDWLKLIYNIEFKKHQTEDDWIDWSVERCNSYDKYCICVDEFGDYVFSKESFTEEFLEYVTYILYFGIDQEEFNISSISKMDFEKFHSNTLIDFNTLIIPGLEKIKILLKEANNKNHST